MNDDRTQPDPERLLANSDWARRLAARLLGDAAAADDVVQEAWFAAATGGIPADLSVRAWLGGTVRHLALHARRSFARRRRHEGGAAVRDEVRVTPAGIAERVEGQRLLADAVAALEEPFRTAVVLRYFDGLSGAAVAKRLGVPAATVRWRLMRGRELLRERLDRHFGGDRKAWCLALVPLAGPPPFLASLGIAAGKAAQGVLSMKLKSQLVAAATALLVLFGTYELVFRADHAAPDAKRSGTAVAASGAEVSPDAPRGSAPAIAAAPFAEEAERDGAGAAARRTPATAAFRILARCVDERGVPISGATLVEAKHAETLRGASGADGRVEIEAALPVQDLDRIGTSFEMRAVFLVRRPGFAYTRHRATVTHARPNDLGDIVLPAGGAVRGTVCDVSRNPVAGARVVPVATEIEAETRSAWRKKPYRPGDENPWADTDAAGRFELWVAPGGTRLVAGAAGFGHDVSEPLDVRAGGMAGPVELRLERVDPPADPSIEGRVRDPEGRPVTDAAVTLAFGAAGGSSRSKDVFTDGEGRFRTALKSPDPAQALALTVRAGNARLAAVRIEGIRPGTKGLEIRLPAGRTMQVDVVDAGGDAVRAGAVVLLPAGEDHSGPIRPVELFRSALGTGAAGGAVAVTIPALPFVVEVDAPGFDVFRDGPLDPAGAAARLRCVLTRLPGIRGRVRAGKSPVAGARVVVHADAGEGRHVVCNGFPSWVRERAVAEARTGDDGAFDVACRRAGLYRLEVEAAGFAAATHGPFDIDPARGIDGLDLALADGGAIEGRVLAGLGGRVAGTVVAISQGGVRVLAQPVGSDGAFRFTGLAPGPWMMKGLKRMPDPSSFHLLEGAGSRPPFPWACEVRSGETTRRDLDLSEGTPVVVEGAIGYAAPGTPAWSARLISEPKDFQGRVVRADVDAAGRFRAELPWPGAWDLVLTLNGPEHTLTEIRDRIDARAPAASWARTIPTGMLTWTPAAGAAIRPLRHEWQGEGSLRVVSHLHPDASGRPLEVAVPAGRGRIRAADPAAEGSTEPSDSGIRDVDVPAGGVLAIEGR